MGNLVIVYLLLCFALWSGRRPHQSPLHLPQEQRFGALNRLRVRARSEEEEGEEVTPAQRPRMETEPEAVEIETEALETEPENVQTEVENVENEDENVETEPENV